MPIFALAVAGVLLAAFPAAAALRLRSPVSFLLALYVLGTAEVVVLTEVLSLVRLVGRTGYLAGEAIVLAITVIAWLGLGRPAPARIQLQDLSPRHHPLLVALAVLVGASIFFQAFLVVASPPDNIDSMTYHLPRAVEWYQRGAVERFPAFDETENAYPVNAEIQILYTFTFLGRDTLAAAPQFLARIALLLAVFGIARLAGFGRPASAFASLVFSCFTLVVVQAVTTQNDLVLAALVAAAAYFALETVSRDVRASPVAGLAVGLAVGTKWPGLAAVPALALVALAASREWKRLGRLVAWALVGLLAVGISSYVRNFDATGSVFGKVAQLAGVQKAPAARTIAATLYHLTDDFVDFSSYYKNANEDTSFFGTLGWAFILPLSACFVVAALLRRTRPVRGALAVALPILLAEIAVAHADDRFSGRLLIGPVALCAALGAWAYQRPWLARPTALLAAATLVLAVIFNPAKPVGILGTPVWALPRVAAETLKAPELGPVFVNVDALVPQNARVGVVRSEGSWVYPLYGRSLGRHLVRLSATAPFEEAESIGLRWVIFAGEGPTSGHPPRWRLRQLGLSGWMVADRLRAP